MPAGIRLKRVCFFFFFFSLDFRSPCKAVYRSDEEDVDVNEDVNEDIVVRRERVADVAKQTSAKKGQAGNENKSTNAMYAHVFYGKVGEDDT